MIDKLRYYHVNMMANMYKHINSILKSLILLWQYNSHVLENRNIKLKLFNFEIKLKLIPATQHHQTICLLLIFPPTLILMWSKYTVGKETHKSFQQNLHANFTFKIAAKKKHIETVHVMKWRKKYYLIAPIRKKPSRRVSHLEA